MKIRQYFKGPITEMIASLDQGHDVRAIANALPVSASKIGNSIIVIMLLKLVYLVAQGWSLVVHNKPIPNLTLQAWQHGPVYPEIHSAFKQHRANPISSLTKISAAGEP